MEKRKLTGKTILKLAGAILALAYFGFSLYAGITGNIPSMHKVQYVVGFRDIKNWVSGGISAIVIFSLCVNSALNDLNIRIWREKSFLPILLLVVFPVIGITLLESYLDIGWRGIALYAIIAALLFAIAWIPPMMNKLIARRLLHDGSLNGKQQMQVIEWIHFYPLKKLLILGIWSFGVVIILRGIWVTATGMVEPDAEMLLFLLGTTAVLAALFPIMKRYICKPYHSVPVLNQILSKSQLEQLMDAEHFEQMQFQNSTMNQSLDIYQSKNWMVINGKLLSKKLALQVTTDHQKHDSVLKVLYLNGMTAIAKVGLDIGHPAYEEFACVLQELTGHDGPLVLRRKEEQLSQKFSLCFPDCPTEQERMAVFLSRDAAQIRQDFIQTFSPPDNRKKKRNMQHRK